MATLVEEEALAEDRALVERVSGTGECQKSCQVPFKPTGEKPVYCSDCFGNKGGRSGGDRPQRRDFGDRGSSRPSFGGGNDDIKRQIEGMNAKLDRLADAIETLSLRWEK